MVRGDFLCGFPLNCLFYLAMSDHGFDPAGVPEGILSRQIQHPAAIAHGNHRIAFRIPAVELSHQKNPPGIRCPFPKDPAAADPMKTIVVMLSGKFPDSAAPGQTSSSIFQMPVHAGLLYLLHWHPLVCPMCKVFSCGNFLQLKYIICMNFSSLFYYFFRILHFIQVFFVSVPLFSHFHEFCNLFMQ